ncbi:MAG: hypothetical protein J6S14_11350, partial [Clostridia bacterium]|nr:hypothetical protein [Clostridia bacterium]
MKTTFKRATALLLSLLMVFSVCSTALVVYAADADESNEINYVSLGDSMSNGYGLPGYDGNTGVEDYGEGAYGNQFAAWLETSTGKNVNHAQLAMSAMRAEDLHWLLELDYTDAEAIAITDGAWDEAAWNAKFSTGDKWTWKELCNDYRLAVAAYAIENAGADGKITDDEAAIVAKYYQDSVKNADIISLGMGNGNFGVFAFGRIMEAIGFDGEPSDAMIYKVENAIRECAPELQAQILELKADLYSAVEGKLGQPISANPTLEALANTIVYTGLSYVLNYAGSVEAILQLNPDAEIILVALMNTYKGDDTVEGITMGDVLDAIFIPLNAFIAALPTYMQATQNSVYADAKFYYAEAPMVECLVNEYGKDFYAVDEDGNAVLHKPNESSTIRKRFVESIVGTATKPGMIWGMLSTTFGLVPVTFDEICEYEQQRSYKLQWAQENGFDKAKSIAIYLAFENAIIDAGQSAPVTINSVLGLGNLDPAMFGGVSENYAKNVSEMLAANLVKNADGEYEEDAYFKPAGAYVDDVLAATAGPDNEATQAAAAFIGAGLGVRSAVRFPGSAINKLTTFCGDAALAEGIYNGVIEQFTAAYTLLATPDALSAAVSADPNLNGLCNLFARCVIGNGLGAHPSQKGHDALFEAVKNAYVNDYTAADKTFENIYYVITTYYDDAYAYAYDYAEQSGYIAAAIGAIENAEAAVNNIAIPFPTATTEAFVAQAYVLKAEIAETLAQAKAFILAADELDQETLDALLALLGSAAEDLNDMAALLNQAAADVNTLAIIPAINAAYNELVNNVIPTVKSMLEQAVIEGTKKFVELAKTALG